MLRCAHRLAQERLVVEEATWKEYQAVPKVEDSLEFSSPDGKTKVWVEADEETRATHLWLYTEQRSVLRSILAEEEIGAEIKKTVSPYMRADNDKPFAWQLRLERRHWGRVSKLEGVPEVPRRALAAPSAPKNGKPEEKPAKSPSRPVAKGRKIEKEDVGLSKDQKDAIALIGGALNREDRAKRVAKAAKAEPKPAPKAKSTVDVDEAIRAIVAKRKAEHEKAAAPAPKKPTAPKPSAAKLKASAKAGRGM